MIFLEVVLVIVLALLCIRSYFAIKRLDDLEHKFNKLVEVTSDITKTLNGLLPLVETSLGANGNLSSDSLEEIQEAEVTEVEENSEEEGEA